MHGNDDEVAVHAIYNRINFDVRRELMSVSAITATGAAFYVCYKVVQMTQAVRTKVT